MQKTCLQCESISKIITSTDSERLLSAASASHVTDEKRKKLLLLVTVKARQFGHVLHNSNSDARVLSPNTMLLVSWSVTFLFQLLKACDNVIHAANSFPNS